MILAHFYEPFADVARRLNIVSRLILAIEALEDGDPEYARDLLADLERELTLAIEQNEEPLEAAA